ncbi:M13 family metallopeptidase [Butyrivibrio sp. AE2032]|uniref:M13 family metallopeptidase n=1 Tax=Butyrivibrio sp. AE2032 TaxID=1458463 RepID=UPI0005562D31|nr:M13 family metallopeptidase [Butyrivibrio sp. AE2032]
MKKVAVIAVTAVMAVPLMTGCGAVTTPVETSESETSVKELGPARAQDDYYRFVNQDRFDTAEFEYGESTVEMAFNSKLIEEQIDGIIEDIAAGSGYAKGSEEDIIKHAFDYYMDYDFDNEPIPEDLMNMIEAVDNAKTVDELMDIEARLVRDYGISGILGIEPGVDPFDPQRRIMFIAQLEGVLNTSFKSMRDELYAADYIRADGKVIMMTRGYDKDTAEQYGKELAYLAIDLYSATDFDALEDAWGFESLDLYTPAQVDEIFTNVDIKAYLEKIGYDTSGIDTYGISDAEQLKALNAIFDDKNINALKTWELGNLYDAYSRYIAPHYGQISSTAHKDYRPLREKALDDVSANFKNETDPIYVEKYYSAEMDKALRDMCDDIRAGYREIISGADWLSEPVREELLKKLENIVYVTGVDSKRHDNSEYLDICGSNYYELCLNYRRLIIKDKIKSLTEPVSRTDIAMPMQMFNACYDPSFNNITITVAITNAPFFDVNADYYTNLGGLGSVIAHEMGHAFDSDCIMFNSKGEYDPSWISADDMAILTARNEKAVRYFEDNFTVFGIYHVDGEQTLGENYADLGGVECITSLAKTKEDRIRLFESYATVWCEMSSDESIIGQIAYDSHSPAVIRVNAVLGSIDEFYETYDVTEGDGMYIAPEDRISRWY